MRPLLLLPLALCLAAPAALRGETERAGLLIEVTDGQGQPLPCRVHLADAEGQPQHGPTDIFWKDHVVCRGRQDFSLPPGRYRYAVERGPEWESLRGDVELKAGERRTVTLHPERLVDLAAEGWYSGDLHVHRPPNDMPLHLEAEQLNVAPTITWWNRKNLLKDLEPGRQRLQQPSPGRYYDYLAGEDEREGGALLFFGLDEPLPIEQATPEYPSPMKFVAEARRRNPKLHIDIEKPFWWDVPAWLASGQTDTMGIAHNHMHRSGVLADEAWGRPRDPERLPPPLGNGEWTQEIYTHVLNAGLRVPPSAGSASGVLPNPVGYNRVYVHLDGGMDYPRWWEGLKAGRSFVTNGALLRCRANGQLPGHVFRSPAGKPLAIRLAGMLTTSERVPQLEIVQDGRVAGTIPRPGNGSGAFTGEVTFRESGWFMVRARTENRKTYRFAATAPFYVEVGDTPRRVSRRSARFFLDWANERIGRVERNVKDADQRREVLEPHLAARAFWEERLRTANAD